MMSDFKDVYVMELPNTQSADARELWKKEVYKVADFLAERFDTELTYENLKKAIEMTNDIRRARQELCEVMENDPTPIDGFDLSLIHI